MLDKNKENSETMTGLHANPFWVLRATSRDDNRKILDAAEERSLFIDPDICQKASSTLVNPRTRLAAEIAWLPGVSPRMADELLITLSENPLIVRQKSELPDLALANLMAAASELVEDNESAEAITEFIVNFAWVAESIDTDTVMRDINEDRAIAGIPQVQSSDTIEDELSERRKAYRSVLRNLLDRLDSHKLIRAITSAVSEATSDGEAQGPALIDDLVDSYEVGTQ
ncbi:MAG TPA: hypothetical protein VKA94_07305, partial [Hyphomicrobiales bacterium]|nr:hypothetical protein [Hyphomicrobiales bacterium]